MLIAVPAIFRVAYNAKLDRLCTMEFVLPNVPQIIDLWTKFARVWYEYFLKLQLTKAIQLFVETG